MSVISMVMSVDSFGEMMLVFVIVGKSCSMVVHFLQIYWNDG